MPKTSRVTLIVSARDATRGVFRRIRRSFRGLASRGAGFVGALLAGLGIRAFTNFATSVDNASKRVRLGVEELQRWRKVASDVGISPQTTTTVMQRMNSRIGEAVDGSEQMAQNLEAVGVLRGDMEDLERIGVDEAFLRMSAAAEKAFKAGRARQFQNQLRKVLDIEGVPFLALLQKGPEELAKALAEAPVTAEEAIKRTADAERELRTKMLEAQAALQDVISESLPLFTQATQNLAEQIRILNELIPKIPGVTGQDPEASPGAGLFDSDEIARREGRFGDVSPLGRLVEVVQAIQSGDPSRLTQTSAARDMLQRLDRLVQLGEENNRGGGATLGN